MPERSDAWPPRPLGNSATYAVVLADVDRDGDLDLVEGNDYGFWNAVWMNDGRGNFSSEYFFGVEDRTRDLAVGDLTGDGFPDIVASNFVVAPGDASKVYVNDGLSLNRLRDEVNRVYLNDGRGNLRPGPTFGAEGTPTRHLALGDVDGDGRLDIVVGNNCANNAVFLNRALRVSR